MTEEKESVEKIITRMAVCTVLHDFLIASNDVRSTYLYEDDSCISGTCADNELNCPANDFSNENERRNQMTVYFYEKEL